MKIRLAALAALTTVSLAGLPLAGCGDSKPAGQGPASSPYATTPPKASQFAGMKISHILIAMEGRRKPVMKRTKEQALQIAKSVLRDVQGGRDFFDAASNFSDDVNPEGKLNTNCNEPGSYEGAVMDNFVKPFQDAVLNTPVGTICPEPVYADPYGYFLIKRIK